MPKKSKIQIIDPSSPAAAKKFAIAAKKYVAKHTKSQAAAKKALVDFGMYTKSGKLSSKYKTIKPVNAKAKSRTNIECRTRSAQHSF